MRYMGIQILNILIENVRCFDFEVAESFEQSKSLDKQCTDWSKQLRCASQRPLSRKFHLPLTQIHISRRA